MMSREAQQQQDAIGRLRAVLPKSDPPDRWYDDYRLAMHRLEAVKWRYGIIAVPLVLAISFAAMLAIAALFPGVNVVLSISTGLASLALGSVAVRKMLLFLPGFSWAQEYDLLVELLPPFKAEVDRRAGRNPEGPLEL